MIEGVLNDRGLNKSEPNDRGLNTQGLKKRETIFYRSKEETRALGKFENAFSFVMRCLFHPLSLITILMTLNKSDVAPGINYASTLHCLRDLYSTSAFYRGFLFYVPWYIPVNAQFWVKHFGFYSVLLLIWIFLKKEKLRNTRVANG